MLKVKNEKELISLLRVFAEESVIKAKKVLREDNDHAQESYLNSLKQDEKLYNVSLSEQEDEAVTPEKLGVSFDSVLKDINTLRAGRSTKDKEIKEELLEYYDRLDEDERQILQLFLHELSRILQGALTGDAAIEPSDAPYNFDIERASPDDNKVKVSNETESGGAASEEDSSPPIKVNESQDLHEIRNKIKNLMKRF